MADYLVIVVGEDTEGKKELVRHLLENGFGRTRLSRRLRTAERCVKAKPPRPVKRVTHSCVAEYGWRHLGRGNHSLLHHLGAVVVCVGKEPWHTRLYGETFCMPHAIFRNVDVASLKEFDEALLGGRFDGPLGHQQVIFGASGITGPATEPRMLAGYVKPEPGEVRVPLHSGSVPMEQWWRARV